MTWRHRHQEEESELRIGFSDATHNDTCTKEGCPHRMPGETAKKWKSQSSPLSPLCNCWWELTETTENPPCCTDDAGLYCWHQWDMMVIPSTGFLSILILCSLLFSNTNYTNIWQSCCGHHENNCKVVNTSLQTLTSWSRTTLKYSNSLVDFSAVY